MSDASAAHDTGSRDIPRWVRVVDVASVASVLFAICLVVGSGSRFDLLGNRVVITSPIWPLLAAAVLLAVRNLLFPRPSVLERIAGAFEDDAIASGVTTALITRLTVYAIGFYAVFALGYGVKPPFVVAETELGNLQARWDAGWYLGIARDGYKFDPNYHQQQNIAFFPAYPWLMRLGGPILGRSARDLSAAGTVLSVLAFSLALIRLYRLVLEMPASGRRPAAARAAVLLLAVYPFAVFYGAIYTEALFLLCAVSAFLYAERGRWGLVAPWALIAGLTRPNGVVLCVPLAWMAVVGIRTALPGWWRPAAVRLAAAAMPVAGFAVFCGYMYWMTGNPFQWIQMHAAWGREFTGIQWLINPIHEMWLFGLEGFVRSDTARALNFVAVVFALVLLVPVTRRLGLAYGLFIVANLIPPLTRGGLLSMGRLTSTLFPMFIWLALATSERARDRWIAVFAMGEGLMAMLFYTWRPPY
jgi:hypothetical protein